MAEETKVAITKETVERLIKKHIARYIQMRDSADTDRSIRLDEVGQLLDIWRSIERKLERGVAVDKLAVEEQWEIKDALEAGE